MDISSRKQIKVINKIFEWTREREREREREGRGEREGERERDCVCVGFHHGPVLLTDDYTLVKLIVVNVRIKKSYNSNV